jgi:hypothetical protein
MTMPSGAANRDAIQRYQYRHITPQSSREFPTTKMPANDVHLDASTDFTFNFKLSTVDLSSFWWLESCALCALDSGIDAEPRCENHW